MSLCLSGSLNKLLDARDIGKRGEVLAYDIEQSGSLTGSVLLREVGIVLEINLFKLDSSLFKERSRDLALGQVFVAKRTTLPSSYTASHAAGAGALSLRILPWPLSSK